MSERNATAVRITLEFDNGEKYLEDYELNDQPIPLIGDVIVATIYLESGNGMNSAQMPRPLRE